MLKLHTRTQQTPSLIFNGLVCYTCSSGVCDRALKKRPRVENVTFFCCCCLSIFATSKFLTKLCITHVTLKPWLLTLSTGYSIKASAKLGWDLAEWSERCAMAPRRSQVRIPTVAVNLLSVLIRCWLREVAVRERSLSLPVCRVTQVKKICSQRLEPPGRAG
jgi:hypothetical protein